MSQIVSWGGIEGGARRPPLCLSASGILWCRVAQALAAYRQADYDTASNHKTCYRVAQFGIVLNRLNLHRSLNYPSASDRDAIPAMVCDR